MPFTAHTGMYLEENGHLAVSLAERQWTASTLGTLGSSYNMVWPDPTQDDALEKLVGVIRDLADFTIVVENYVEGRFVPRPPVVLTDQRNYVQHRLMSLDSDDEIESRQTTPVDCLYRLQLSCGVSFSSNCGLI